MKRLGSLTVQQQQVSNKNAEPRVIADEPMEEEQDQSNSPIKKGFEEKKIIVPQLDMGALEQNNSKVFEPASTKNQSSADEFNVFARLSQGKGRQTVVNNALNTSQS